MRVAAKTRGRFVLLALGGRARVCALTPDLGIEENAQSAVLKQTGSRELSTTIDGLTF